MQEINKMNQLRMIQKKIKIVKEVMTEDKNKNIYLKNLIQ